jgi:hypothetical protein
MVPNGFPRYDRMHLLGSLVPSRCLGTPRTYESGSGDSSGFPGFATWALHPPPLSIGRYCEWAGKQGRDDTLDGLVNLPDVLPEGIVHPAMEDGPHRLIVESVDTAQVFHVLIGQE